MCEESYQHLCKHLADLQEKYPDGIPDYVVPIMDMYQELIYLHQRNDFAEKELLSLKNLLAVMVGQTDHSPTVGYVLYSGKYILRLLPKSKSKYKGYIVHKDYGNLLYWVDCDGELTTFVICDKKQTKSRVFKTLQKMGDLYLREYFK